MLPHLRHAIHDDSGQTLSEYAILLALVAVVVIVAIEVVGGSVADLWCSVTRELKKIAHLPPKSCEGKGNGLDL